MEKGSVLKAAMWGREGDGHTPLPSLPPGRQEEASLSSGAGQTRHREEGGGDYQSFVQ